MPDSHLEAIRTHELLVVKEWFKPKSRVLEIGGDNGFQAKIISDWGLEVHSLDLAGRTKSPEVHFPVGDYDGRNIPYPDRSFDIVYSSNVLEHVKDVGLLLIEMRRVLKGGGIAIHQLPTSSWRFWTSFFYPIYLLKRLIGLFFSRDGESEKDLYIFRGNNFFRVLNSWFGPHGEYPNAVSELYYYSLKRWRKVFENNGFTLVYFGGNGIFYTGNRLIEKLPFFIRLRISKILGQSGHIFVMKPKNIRGSRI